MREVINAAITENIERAGVHIFGIFDPSGKEDAFFYTIGNHLRGLPEILLIAPVPDPVAMDIINRVCAIQAKSEKALEEGLLDIAYSMPLKVRKCTALAKSEYSIQAGQYLKTEDYDILQIMIPDRTGKFPGEEGCTPVLDVNQP